LQAEKKTASAAEPTQTVRFAAAYGVDLGFKRGVILKNLRENFGGWKTR
jgi:hypothetical protein